jgi:triosephosphate isomerase
MYHKKMIAGNWKMNREQSATSDFINKLEDWFEENDDGKRAAKAIEEGSIEVVIAPPFTSISAAVAARRDNSRIHISAQNVHYEHKGAYTGEISLDMLAETGCKYVIIGHSERRHVFGETNTLLERKLVATLESKVLPIFCVGELLDDREAGRTDDVLRQQLEGAWFSLTSDLVSEMLVIAYEPVWAIGTGRTASDKDADDACAYIRDLAREKFGGATSDALRVLYGGSVKPENSAGIMAQKNIDGLLIGGASLDVESFTKIIPTAV